MKSLVLLLCVYVVSSILGTPMCEFSRTYVFFVCDDYIFDFNGAEGSYCSLLL